MWLFSSVANATSRSHTRALSTRSVDTFFNLRSAVLTYGLAAALLGSISVVNSALAESTSTSDVADRAAMAISSGSVSDDFANAMRGVVSDSSQDPCGDFTRAVSTGIQAAAPAAGGTGTNPSVAMSESVATSLLGMVTSFCSFTPGEPPPAKSPAPNIIINIKDACEDVKRQLARAEDDLKDLNGLLKVYRTRFQEQLEKIERLEATIEKQANQIAQQAKDIAARDAIIRDLQGQLAQCAAKAVDKKCAAAEAKVEKIETELNTWKSQRQLLEHKWEHDRPFGSRGQDLLKRQIAQAVERVADLSAELKRAKAAQKKACS